MIKEKLQTSFLLGLLLATAALAFFIFLPYLNVLTLAIVLAIVFEPLYQKLLAISFKKEWLAAFLTIFIVIFIVLIPLALLGILLWREAAQFYAELANGNQGTDVLKNINFLIGNKLKIVDSSLSIDIGYLEKQTAGWIFNQTGAIFSSVAQFTLGLFLVIITLFYLLKDGTEAARALLRLSPLNDADNDTIMEKLKKAVRSIVAGTLVVAIIQGLLVSAGFYMFGISRGMFWGSISAVASLIPPVGIIIITAPVAAYLFIIGKTAAGIGLFVWGLAVVVFANNFLAPKLIRRGTGIHPLLILFSVLGGLAFFGPIGFLMGPLVLSLLLTLLEIYRNHS